MSKETELIELTRDEMKRAADGENVTSDGWTIGPNGLNITESSAQKILDGEMDFASWTGRATQKDVAVTLKEDETSGRTEAAEKLFTIFQGSRGDGRALAQEALHDLGFDVEKTYDLVDTRGEE